MSAGVGWGFQTAAGFKKVLVVTSPDLLLGRPFGHVEERDDVNLAERHLANEETCLHRMAEIERGGSRHRGAQNAQHGNMSRVAGIGHARSLCKLTVCGRWDPETQLLQVS